VLPAQTVKKLQSSSICSTSATVTSTRAWKRLGRWLHRLV